MSELEAKIIRATNNSDNWYVVYHGGSGPVRLPWRVWVAQQIEACRVLLRRDLAPEDETRVPEIGVTRH